MNLKPVLQLISYMVMVIGLGMAASWGISVYFIDPAQTQLSLAWCSVFALAAGLVLRVLTRGPVELSRRDGFAIVTLGWITACAFGALPFIFSGVIPHPVSAVFETMSGFTTTGASVIDVMEDVPRGILLWRALTHFFGGMGVLVLCVAILPFLGVGGMQVFRAEMPGPSKDRLTPRIATTAKYFWGLYILLCLLEALLLRLGGVSWFDAFCHSFATVATGGFSTRTVSVGAFQSPYVETVILVFMFLAGTNFALHYRALQNRPLAYFRDPEFRFYVGICTVTGFALTFMVWKASYDGFGEALRAGFFQSVSIMTTTGFTTADFAQWPALAKFLLILLMFVGGCAGSTGGGIKVVRIFVMIKEIVRQLRLFMQPQAVIQVKLGRDRIESGIVSNIVAFFMIYVLVFVAASVVMCFFTPDLESALSSVAATLGNVGPGLSVVGPMACYSEIPTAGQAILTVCMLLGRLELYTVLVLFLPSFWKK